MLGFRVVLGLGSIRVRVKSGVRVESSVRVKVKSSFRVRVGYV